MKSKSVAYAENPMVILRLGGGLVKAGESDSEVMRGKRWRGGTRLDP